MTRSVPIFLALLLGGTALADEPTDGASKPTVDELLDTTDDIQRGESSIATMTMRVQTSRYDRTVKMKAWTEGEDKSLIKILEPAKEKGVATLKVDDNIWNYMPKVDRTIKLPPAMMSGNWMGSHVTNDDLVKESRMSEDYDATMVSEPDDEGTGSWVIDLTPKPDAPVVWGKVTVTIHADKVPDKIEYYDEDGELQRTLKFLETAEFDGRQIPRGMKVLPADKPEEFTEIIYDDLDFDVEIDDTTFSLQALRR